MDWYVIRVLGVVPISMEKIMWLKCNVGGSVCWDQFGECCMCGVMETLELK